ncbi:helix-turn-helix transcriptional regulator [Methylobacterium nigriterrae]|uniref:helix-turn-helix transcriptional regulator n=1 Tax=Methylobacterium nigriterrae TaxID=3127512 RepID=UPI0030134300
MMKVDPAFSVLIGRVYDCALDTSGWPSVLAEIAEVVQGYLAEMAIYDPIAGSVKFAAHHGYTEDLLTLTHSIMHLNPMTPLGLVHPLLEPACMSREQYATVESLRASLYWRKGWADRDHDDHMSVPLTRSATEFGTWGISTTRTRGPFSDEDIEFARLISPHLRRSVLISGILGHQQVETQTLRSALDALSAAALILAPDGRIVFQNAQAQAELARASMLRESQGRLVGVTADGMRLVAGIQARNGSQGRDMRIEDAAGRVLHASWVVLDKISEAVGEPLLLLLREPEQELVTPLSSAATLFRLTSGELQVLAQLLNGRTLAETAEILGVARSTVKTHLDALFRKTDTKRQADLLRVVIGLGSPIKADRR